MDKPSRATFKSKVIPATVLIFFIIAIPLPFKPSIWSFVIGNSINNHLDKSTDDIYLGGKIHELSPLDYVYSKIPGSGYMGPQVFQYSKNG